MPGGGGGGAGRHSPLLSLTAAIVLPTVGTGEAYRGIGEKGGTRKSSKWGRLCESTPPPAFHLEKSVPCFVARGGTYSSQGKRCTAMQFWYCAMASRDASTWTLLSCSHRRRPLS